METGCGTMYVTFHKEKDSKDKDNYKVITRFKKIGSCHWNHSQIMNKMFSLNFKLGNRPTELIEFLSGLHCGMPYDNIKAKNNSCADAVGQMIKEYFKDKK
jgi:hypothetical protein